MYIWVVSPHDPGMSFHLRRAGGADAAAVRQLFHDSFTATFAHLYPPAELAGFLADATEERFRLACEAPDQAVMLGEAEDGTPLGYCALGPLIWKAIFPSFWPAAAGGCCASSIWPKRPRAPALPMR